MNPIIIKTDEHEEYLEQLSSCNKTLVISSCGEYLKHYAVIKLNELNIGLVYEEGSVYPKVKLDDVSEYLYVGIDKKLILIAVKNQRVLWEILFFSLFVDVIFLTEDSLIVIEEVGVSLYTRSGIMEWTCVTDLITGYKLLDGVINVSQMDSPDVKILLSTGKFI